MDLWGEQTKLVCGEKKETDVQQEADVERPCGEREGGNAGVLASATFSFPGSDHTKKSLRASRYVCFCNIYHHFKK